MIGYQIIFIPIIQKERNPQIYRYKYVSEALYIYYHATSSPEEIYPMTWSMERNWLISGGKVIYEVLPGPHCFSEADCASQVNKVVGGMANMLFGGFNFNYYF